MSTYRVCVAREGYIDVNASSAEEAENMVVNFSRQEFEAIADEGSAQIVDVIPLGKE